MLLGVMLMLETTVKVPVALFVPSLAAIVCFPAVDKEIVRVAEKLPLESVVMVEGVVDIAVPS